MNMRKLRKLHLFTIRRINFFSEMLRLQFKMDEKVHTIKNVLDTNTVQLNISIVFNLSSSKLKTLYKV